MEYLTNRPHSTSFTHFISMFLLFFFLLRSFGIRTEGCKDPYSCFKNTFTQKTDFVVVNTPFDERRWFFDYSRSGQPLICSQRINVFNEFYNQSPIECSFAKEINEIPNDEQDQGGEDRSPFPQMKPGDRCWIDGDGNIFCKSPTTVRLLRTTKNKLPVKKNRGVTFASNRK